MNAPLKISVNFSDAATATLRDLAAQSDTTVTNVIRRALAIYKFVNDELNDGKRFELVRDDRREPVVWTFREDN